MTFPALAFGGTDLVLINDHRLRDSLVTIAGKPFPAPDGTDPLVAFAQAMAAKFPSRWPNADANAAQAFLASIANGMRLGYVETRRQIVLPTDRAAVALKTLDVIRSSCGATMVRDRQEGRPAPTIYCHYCGSLL